MGVLETRGVTLPAVAEGSERLRRLRKRCQRLAERVALWMEDQRNLVEDGELRYFVVLAERFTELHMIPFMCEVKGDDVLRPSTSEAEVTLVLAGVAAAAKEAAPREDWTPPLPVIAALLRLVESSRGGQGAVDPPQLLAAAFAGWRPPCAAFPQVPPWEPGRLLVKAMVYKHVHAGLHHLAEVGVAPLTTLRCKDHTAFARLVAEATHLVSASVVSPPQPTRQTETVTNWSCTRPLWEVMANLVVGPGPKGKRPQAGAYGSTLLGGWARKRLGVTVGTALRYACGGCGALHCDRWCGRCRREADVLAARRHQFVTDRKLLVEYEGERGYEPVSFKRCHDPGCEATLYSLTGVPGLWSIYPATAERCPGCRSRTKRTVTLWVRQP